MPRSERWTIKRTLDGAESKVIKSRDELLALAGMYKDGYPDYYNSLMAVANILDQAAPLIRNIRDAV